jgi:Uncharacterized conserved protein
LYNKIQELLRLKADYQARLNLIPFDGSPEIKENGGHRYIYIRKRIASKLTSTYVDVYSEELYQKLLKDAKESRFLKKEIRHIEKDLIKLGYINEILEQDVLLNLDYARSSMKEIIYDQAILEGVSTTFPQTETIIENGTVSGMKVSDIQKILNLKHAWEFVLDKDMMNYPSNLDILSHIAKLVNEGFYEYGGRLRTVPVSIGGSNYKPPFPIEIGIKKKLTEIISGEENGYLVAIKLCLYCMKSQIFIDGNKRASIILANHYLISHGKGLLVINHDLVKEFKQLLIDYYEDKNHDVIDFLLNKCIRKLK